MEPIQIEKLELIGIKNLINSILGKSGRGLFYSMGQIIGKNIADQSADRSKEKYFTNAGEIMIKRHLAKSITFEGDLINVTGSVEVPEKKEAASDANKCHILRGIIVALYETQQNKKMYCDEIECQSLGAERCVFKIEKEVF